MALDVSESSGLERLEEFSANPDIDTVVCICIWRFSSFCQPKSDEKISFVVLPVEKLQDILAHVDHFSFKWITFLGQTALSRLQ